jgi:quercetin dioxygenase-like cupin family protein
MRQNDDSNRKASCMRQFLLIAAAFLPASSMAQTASTPIPDALTADPLHYTVEFENADVRILRIKYPAHSKGNMHDHPHSATVFLTQGKLRMTMPDGKTIIGNVPKGAAVFEEAGPHQPENIGDEDFEAVRIELKH